MAQAKVPPPQSRKAAAKPGSTPAVSRPSLDVLVKRVNDYWDFLVRGERLQASRYVEASCKDDFIVRPFPNFSSPRITRLEPDPSGKEVNVTVSVKRILPPLPGQFDYPVITRWVFTGGTWWVVMNDDDLPMFPRKTPFETYGSVRKELDKKKAAIRTNLHFPKREIDLGTVRQGEAAEFTVEYRLAGDLPMEVQLQNSSLEIQRFAKGQLRPGTRQQFPMKLLTTDYDGPVQGSFAFLVRQGDAEVSYDFTLKGKVYTPISITPQVLRFLPDEKEKEIEIKNNTALEARLSSLSGGEGRYDVKPLPQSLPPGARRTLKVTRLGEKSPGKGIPVLVINLAQPVDGMRWITLPVETLAEPLK
jgi:hypothetical protein